MDGISFDIREEGFLDVDAFFEYAGYKTRDMREPLHEVKYIIQESIDNRLENEGYGEWEPLTERYGEWKMLRAPMAPMLELSGEMRQVIDSEDAWRLTATTLTYDTMQADPGLAGQLPGFHQEGAERSKGGRLPARTILDLSEGDYEAMEQAFVDWLDGLRDANARRGFADASLRPSVFF